MYKSQITDDEDFDKGRNRIEEIVTERTAELKKANDMLHAEVIALRRMEEELRKHREHLRDMVLERTADLEKANAELRAEIAEHKRTEESLRVSDELFQAVSEYSPNAICIVDEKARLTWVNSRLIEISGYTREELLSAESFLAFLAPESVEFVMNNYFRFVAGDDYVHDYQFKFIRSDGDKRLMQKYMTDFTDKYGTKNLIISMLDITEKEKAEENLRKSEERLRLTLDATQDGIWDYDIQSGKLQYSPHYYTMLGYEPYEFSETPGAWESLVHPDDLPLAKDIIRQCIKSGRSFTQVYRMKRKPGEWCWILGRGMVVVHDEQGLPIRMVGTISDITAQKRIEIDLEKARKEAEEASRLKSSILANMSHEFRTPVHGILGLAEILSGEMKDSRQKETIDLIREAGQRLFNTLDAFMKMSQLSTGEFEVRMRPLQCGPAAETIAEGFRSAAEGKRLSLVIDIKQDSQIAADEDMFRDILHNIIDNAVKFTSKGEIRVTVDRQDISGIPHAAVHVRDTGIGFIAEHGDLLFQEFRQLSEGIARTHEGSGLGLTLAKRMTDLMKGRLTFESEPGKGSVFTIAFPLQTALSL